MQTRTSYFKKITTWINSHRSIISRVSKPAVLTIAGFIGIILYNNNSYSDISVLIGIIFFILFPITLFEAIKTPLRLKLPNLGLLENEMIKWLFGSAGVFALYFINYITIKFDISILLVSISTIITVIQATIGITKPTERIDHSPDNKGKKVTIKWKSLAIDAVLLSAITIYYSYFFNSWAPAGTQMTDLFNHNTVVNRLNDGDFALFPSQLTDSIQLSAYTNIFHTMFGVARAFFKAEYLFEFQSFLQLPILFLFYFIFKRFIQYITKKSGEIIAAVGSLLVLIPNAPNLSFNRFAIVPSQVLFIFLPIVILLIKKQKYKTTIALFAILTLFHFMSAVLMLLVIIPLIMTQQQWPKVLFKRKSLTITNLLISLFAAFAILNVFIFKLEFSQFFTNIASFLGFDSDATNSSSSRTIWATLWFGTTAMSPILFAVLTVTILFFTFFIDNKYIWIKIPTALSFALFLLPIPFGRRIASLLPALAAIMIVLSIDSIKTKKLVKIIAISIVASSSMLYIVMQSSNYIYQYYNFQVWTKGELKTVLEAKEIIEDNNIDTKNVYILTEPMTKMLAQSVINSPGAGTYMYPEERNKLYDFVENREFYCGEDEENNEYTHMLFIYTSRLYQWKLDPKKRLSGIDNLWYFLGDDLNSKKEIQEFDHSFIPQEDTIKYSNNGDRLYILTKCKK